MKTKWNVLISSTAIALVLVLALGQGTTNSANGIQELTATEMAAITGTGTCKSSVETPESGSGSCNNGITCHTDGPCGEDWTFTYANTTCTGTPITSGPACGLENTGNPKKTEYDCYCKDVWYSGSDKCATDSTDSGAAKKYKADTSHDCGATTSG